jgi:CheY-like chemotaxis protein
VSRISQGRIELRRETLDLGGLIEQALETVSPMFREKQQTVMLQSGYESVWVSGDRTRLVQALVNVLNNSSKYTHPKGAIRIATRVTGGEVSVEIEDDGAGIDAQLLPSIFELFVQGEQTLDRAQGGLGIGLSVVKKLIEMHGGQVTARSPGVGKGATFEITLPTQDPPPDAVREPDTRQAIPRRVLVVDDNADAANSLAQLLVLEGHLTDVVYTAHSALEHFATFRPEYVLLDIGLPEMDGYEVARRLRADGNGRDVVLVALTGYGQPEDRVRALEAGFDDHLIKPVEFEDLQQILGRNAPA